MLKNALKESFLGDEINSPTEFVRKLRKADFVYLRDVKGKKEIFHLEIQTANDPTMLSRMLLYAGFLYEDHNLPIKQAVLYLGDNKTDNKANLGYFNYEYKVIYIKDIDYREFLKSKDTLIFAILGKFGINTPERALKNIFDKAKEYFQNEKEFLEFLQDMSRFSILRKIDKELEKIITPTNMPFDLDDTKTFLYQKGELKKALATATKLLLKGFNLVEIQDITELSFEQIKALQADLAKKK